MHMKKYLGVARTKLYDIRAFSIDFYSRLAYYPIEMIIIYFLWSLIYSGMGTNVIGGFSFVELISYFVVQRICSRILSYADISSGIEGDVNSGGLCLYLCRPINYLGYLFSSNVPAILIGGISGVPIFVFLAHFFELPFPRDAVSWSLFAFSIGISSVIAFAISVLIGLTAFWTKQVHSIRWIYHTIPDFISGAVIPISFYPQWLQSIFKFLPFQYIYYIPLSIFFGKIDFYELPELFIIQTLWAVVLLVSVKFAWNNGLKVFDAQGG